MKDVAQWIAGTWRLVHSVVINQEGKMEYPYGEDAIGYIYYSGTGIMAVQISRKSRSEVKDLAHIQHDYLAYFGRYEIDNEQQVVRNSVKASFFRTITPRFSKDVTGSRMISCRSNPWMEPIVKFYGGGSAAQKKRIRFNRGHG